MLSCLLGLGKVEMFSSYCAMVILPVATVRVYAIIFVVEVHGQHFLKLD